MKKQKIKTPKQRGASFWKRFFRDGVLRAAFYFLLATLSFVFLYHGANIFQMMETILSMKNGLIV